ncbi:MAG TPA: quinol:electron acceptor oxidoreductase subunit ActD [Bryobacteraceae bacterium]|nr:quinol:electron acceptor oxidoreductase subunit ActD [Bryobacteraceae bacterium]
MAVKNVAAFGIYPDQATVNDAVENLKAAGFRHTDISVLFPENLGSKDFAHEKHTKAPEGAVAGGGSGAVLGAALGWLAGAGTLMVPGLEPMQTAGPVLGMLSGMGVGVTLGGLAGAAAGASVPEYEAKRYEGRVRKGGILLSVHCDNATWAKTARGILKRTGASDISTTGEARADFARTEKPMARGRVDNKQEIHHHSR